MNKLCRQARHGQPTVLLLNLCVTLTAFLVLLYVSEPIATSRLWYGCTCANILRYYLILVSLLWNAAEAVTMYLMFVRVFDSHVSHFGVKAGAIAWGVCLVIILMISFTNTADFKNNFIFCTGVPFILIGLNFAGNKNAFDGSYVDCIFT
jgi:hypothetical protein